VTPVSDRLRDLWDFGDLETTEARLAKQLEVETDDAGRAEVLTQLARVQGLQAQFAAASRLLDEAERRAGSSTVARARIDLERGRSLRSSGEQAAAFPLFGSAYELALESGHDFIAADAAHMAAIADPEGAEAWTVRGVELAERSAAAAYWLGPLYNNLGWARLEAGDAAAALEAFERALAARERQPQRQDEIAIARYCVARSLRELGRPADAVGQAERAVAWADGSGRPDGWFHEELAEDYAALGRDDDAATHARLAIPLLEAGDPSFHGDRAAPLRELADLAEYNQR
jgi:tetratricopeptide (TPR) repeat protein